MATKRKEVENKSELRLRISAEEARKRLAERIKIGSEFKAKSIQSEEQLEGLKKEYYKWDDYNTELLRQIFTNSEPSDEYSRSIGISLLGAIRAWDKKSETFIQMLTGI